MVLAILAARGGDMDMDVIVIRERFYLVVE
jgi:hypothetical protein